MGAQLPHASVIITYHITHKFRWLTITVISYSRRISLGQMEVGEIMMSRALDERLKV